MSESSKNQQEQNNHQNYKGGNFFNRKARDLNGIAQNAGKASEKFGSKAQKFQEKANAQKEFANQHMGTNKAKKAIQRAKALEEKSLKLKKASEKALKLKQQAEKFAQLAAKIGKIITLIGFWILIFMIIIGLTVFLISAWGMLLSGFKEIGRKFYDMCFNILYGQEQNIKDDEIINLINNIEKMGYDLYGYGFVSSTNDNDEYYVEDKLNQELQNKDAFKYLTTYLISDNYAYFIKNNNFNFRTMVTDWKHFLGGIFDQTNWGSGLISIYNQFGNINQITGIRGDPYGVSFGEWTTGASLGAVAGSIIPGIGTGVGAIVGTVGSLLTNWDELTSTIKINRASKTLNISAIGLFNNQVLSYNLDGWIGRYSMPIEFLLATHIATMAPDLSYKLATIFNTDVEILLYKTSGNKMESAVRCGSREEEEVITYKDFNKIAGWSINQQEAYKLFQKYEGSLKSQTEGEYKCSQSPTCSEQAAEDNAEVSESDEEINEEDEHDFDSNDRTSQEEDEDQVKEVIHHEEQGHYVLIDPYTQTYDWVTDSEAWDEYIYEPKACKECRNYLRTIYNAMGKIRGEFSTYIPYINSVTDHWFRDVYFTKQAMRDAGVENVIVPDEDYYLATGEMWTQYEMNPNGDDYETFVYLPDENGNYSGEFATRNGEYLVCRKVSGGSYGVSEEAGNIYIPKDNGGYDLFLRSGASYSDGSITKFKGGKKAITQTKEDDWNAYELTDGGEGQWSEIIITEEADAKVQEVKEMEDVTLLYKLDTLKDISQVEDGVRGETHLETKKLFLDNYYLYDGSGSRAALIEKAKAMAGSDDPDVFRANLGDASITATYKGKEYGPVHIGDISGSINIRHNSLTAFSILKNMHTLDAEYIYHDFKELMVELDYFDKEDLTESIRSVMMFPISKASGISSAGWPVTRYDKSEEFYGTLLHSAEDYETLKERAQQELVELFGMEEEEDQNEVDSASSEEVTSSNLLVQAASDIISYMKANDYAYCQGGSYHSNPSAAHPGRSCYRATSFADSQISGHNLIDCSGFVSWCLQEVGILPSGTLVGSSTIAASAALAPYYTSGHKASYSEYYPGTILIFNKHVTLYAGNGVFYDAGSTYAMHNSPIYIGRSASSVQGYIYIPNNKMTYNGVTGIGSGNEFVEYAGYEGGEAVLAPVTGEVIKYGTVERENLETGNREEVGFIKIRVLGNQEAPPGTECNYFSEEGYNYFWEEYIDANITNHVLYIEGFEPVGGDISALSSYIQGNNEENNYATDYKVPTTVDEAKMAELEAKEQAKKDAPYTIEANGKIYLKEGAVIGHTYSQGDINTVDGVGNYMRLIFRDSADQVVEDVEKYIEIDEVSSNGVYATDEEIVFMAGVLTAECGGVSEEGMAAAAWVIRNRVETGRFGNSLAEVLVKPNQFTVVSKTPNGIKGNKTGEVISMDVNGTTYYVTKPTDEALSVAQRVMSGEIENPIGDRMYWKWEKYDTSELRDPIQIPPGDGNWFHY